MLVMLAPILLFIAFLLLLLVSLSVPIIKTIFLFRLVANVSSGLLDSATTGSVNFGVWGYCTSAVDVSVVGIGHDTAAQCSKVHLGYTFDTTVASALHIDGLENIISRTLTAVLILHPIAAGLAFLTLLISLFTLRRSSNGTSRLASLITLVIGLFASLVTTLIFLIDVILIAIVRHKVHNDTDGDVTMNWGNAVWMTLGAAIAIWISMAGACAGICGHRDRRNRKQASF